MARFNPDRTRSDAGVDHHRQGGLAGIGADLGHLPFLQLQASGIFSVQHDARGVVERMRLQRRGATDHRIGAVDRGGRSHFQAFAGNHRLCRGGNGDRHRGQAGAQAMGTFADAKKAQQQKAMQDQQMQAQALHQQMMQQQAMQAGPQPPQSNGASAESSGAPEAA